MAEPIDTAELRRTARFVPRTHDALLMHRAADELDRRREQEQRLDRLLDDPHYAVLVPALAVQEALDGTPAPDTHQEKP